MKACLSEMFAAEIPPEHIKESLHFLEQKYSADDFAISLYQYADGYQFLTKPAYQVSIRLLLKQSSKKRLSASSIETLSIIAYKQPVTKGVLEQIRGVNCDYAIQKLLEKGLIEMQGKSDGIGRPLLYGTSQKFMDYFGLKNLNELPQTKDIATEENEIGIAGD